MNRYSKWSLVIAAGLLTARLIAPPSPRNGLHTARRHTATADVPSNTLTPDFATRPTGSREARTTTPITQHSKILLSSVIRATDPPTQRIVDRIADALPPGWEDTFVLHDCLLTAAALQEMARMLTHADLLGGPKDARTALEGEDAEFQVFVDRFALLWLSRKHPLLGENTLRSILLENGGAVVPSLGPSNLFDGLEAGEWLEELSIPFNREAM